MNENGLGSRYLEKMRGHYEVGLELAVAEDAAINHGCRGRERLSFLEKPRQRRVQTGNGSPTFRPGSR
jgi:hypothetical protein